VVAGVTDRQDAPDAVEWQQVWLGRADTDPRLGYLKVASFVPINELGVLDPPLVIGESTRASQRVIDSIVYSDLSAGIGIDWQNVQSDTNRIWTGDVDITRPGMFSNGPKVHLHPNPASASGAAYPLGKIGETAYTCWGSHAWGFNEVTGDWYATDNNLGHVPVGKPVAYGNYVYVPMGANGYARLSESAAGALTVGNLGGAGTGKPAYNGTTPTTTSPLPVWFTIYDQKLHAFTTGGAIAWTMTGDDGDWHWYANDSLAVILAMQDGSTPKRTITFRNPGGADAVYVTTSTGLYLLDDTDLFIRNTPASNLPPHPHASGAIAIWRAMEDAWLAVGLDEIHFTADGTFIPLTGPSRDHGLPAKYSGHLVDLTSELSNLYELVAGNPSFGDDAAWVDDSSMGADDTPYAPSAAGAPSLHKWTGIGRASIWFGDEADGDPTWGLVSPVTSAGGDPVDGYRYWWGTASGQIRSLRLSADPVNPKERVQSGRGDFSASSRLVGSRTDMGMSGFWKLASHVVIRVWKASPTETVTIEYQFDDDELTDAWHPLGTVSEPGAWAFAFKDDPDNPRSAGKAFHDGRLAWQHQSDPDDPTKSPVWLYTAWNFLKVPLDTQALTLNVALPKLEYNNRTAQETIEYLQSFINYQPNGAPPEFAFLVHQERTYRGWVTGLTLQAGSGKDYSGIAQVTFVAIPTGDPSVTIGEGA
jgi:hypothetical protein